MEGFDRDTVRPNVSSPTLNLLPDQTEILIVYSEPPPARYRMCTAAVEATIEAFGKMRTVMLPEIPKQWTPGEKVRCFRDPAHFVETDQLAGDAVVHLRDDRFGWLHYILTKAEARKLGEALLAQANADPPAAAGRA